MKIVVIGGGLSGLVAAWKIRENGHDAIVLERHDRVGGQVGTNRVGEFGLDPSLEVLHSCDRHLLSWLNALGLRKRLLPLRPVQVAQVRGGSNSPIDPQSLLGVARIPGLKKLDAARLSRWSRLMARYTPLLDPTAPERAAALDYRSVADFANLYFGSSALSRWVAPEVENIFSGDASELSRVASLLLWRARMTGQGGGALYGLARAGLDPLVEVAAKESTILYEVSATNLAQKEGGDFEIRCDGLPEGQESLSADALIFATSAAEVGRLGAPVLTLPERDFFSEVKSRSTLSLSLKLERPATGMPQLLRVPHEEDLPIESVLSDPGGADGRGLVTLRANQTFTRAHMRAPDEVVEKSLLAALENLYPGVGSSIEASRLRRREDAIPCFDVGAYRALERFRRVQSDRRALGRRLYFAGDYLIAPTAEGRVVAGLRAARDFLSDAGKSESR